MAVQKFRSDRSGNVALIFAIAIIPIVGAAGVAVDYSRVESARVVLQAAVDSTALILGKEIKSLQPSEIQAKAESYFNSMYDRQDTFNVRLVANYDATNDVLILNVSGSMSTSLANVLGVSQMDFSAFNRVVTSGANLEIALVLDNTGSMASSGKMSSMISAAKMFIGELKKNSKKPGDIKVSIIPFDTRVNIKNVYDSAWIDYGGMRWRERQDWDGCVIDRNKSYDVDDTPPTSTQDAWYPVSDSGSRDDDEDSRSSCTLATVLPLTSDFDLATSKLDEMQPEGYTNLTIGLVWGWHALTPGLPLTEAAPASPDVAKYIVFLTDGQNTRNRWSNYTRYIDDRTELVCNNIRAAGINMFTIRVKNGNADLLRKCATSPDMYYDVPAVSEMMKVFENIAGRISKLRIAG